MNATTAKTDRWLEPLTSEAHGRKFSLELGTLHRIDKRVTKEYAARASFLVTVTPPPVDQLRYTDDLRVHGDSVAFLERELPHGPGANVKVDAGISSTSKGKSITYWITVQISFDKPSDIPASTSFLCEEWSPAVNLPAKVLASVEHAFGMAEVRKATERRRVQANHIARSIASNARTAALRACRYEERLAGLQAEFEASQRTALADAIADARGQVNDCGEIVASDGEVFHPKAVDAGLKHAARCMAAPSLSLAGEVSLEDVQ